MGKGREGLQKMRDEFEAENEGIVIPTPVRWLTNPPTIRERRQNGEIAASSVVFIVMGSKMAQSLVKTGIKAAGVWYRVETYTNEGPDSRCELCCGWGHIENKCGSKSKCGIGQAITGQATTSAMWWDALQCKAHSAATR
jgi:hypothetical protein